MDVCGTFNCKKWQCGTCLNFGIIGVCEGVCCVDEKYEGHMASDTCDCGKYKNGKAEELA